MNAGSPVPVGTLPICSFIKAALFSSLWKSDMHFETLQYVCKDRDRDNNKHRDEDEDINKDEDKYKDEDKDKDNGQRGTRFIYPVLSAHWTVPPSFTSKALSMTKMLLTLKFCGWVMARSEFRLRQKKYGFFVYSSGLSFA